jgi:hypothetical protein
VQVEKEEENSAVENIVAGNKPTEANKSIDIVHQNYLERLEEIKSKSINLQDLIWGYYITEAEFKGEPQPKK